MNTDDIRAVAYPALRHRVLTNFNAEAEGIRADDVIRMLIEQTPRAAEDERDGGARCRRYFSAKS